MYWLEGSSGHVCAHTTKRRRKVCALSLSLLFEHRESWSKADDLQYTCTEPQTTPEQSNQTMRHPEVEPCPSFHSVT